MSNIELRGVVSCRIVSFCATSSKEQNCIVSLVSYLKCVSSLLMCQYTYHIDLSEKCRPITRPGDSEGSPRRNQNRGHQNWGEPESEHVELLKNELEANAQLSVRARPARWTAFVFLGTMSCLAQKPWESIGCCYLNERVHPLGGRSLLDINVTESNYDFSQTSCPKPTLRRTSLLQLLCPPAWTDHR